jgi:hypothetical protein
MMLSATFSSIARRLKASLGLSVTLSLQLKEISASMAHATNAEIFKVCNFI